MTDGIAEREGHKTVADRYFFFTKLLIFSTVYF